MKKWMVNNVATDSQLALASKEPHAILLKLGTENPLEMKGFDLDKSQP